MKPFCGQRRFGPRIVLLAFDAAGRSGDPPVVLLHGWPLDRSIWSEVTAIVAAAGFRVLAPDLPSFGESPPMEAERASVEAYADEVAGFLEAFRPDAAAIAGHSFGGYVALALAERRPDLVGSLGLVSSRATSDTEAARTGRHETIKKIRAQGTKALLPGLIEKLLGPSVPVGLRARTRALIERARPDGTIAALAAMATRPDRTSVIEGFRGPALVLHGVADALIPVSEAADARSSTHAVRRILQDVGHLPMWEAPKASADAILEWATASRQAARK